VGPFEKTDLTVFRESDEDELLGRNAVEIIGYCLPGRKDQLNNTCMFMQKVRHNKHKSINLIFNEQLGCGFLRPNLRQISILLLLNVFCR